MVGFNFTVVNPVVFQPNWISNNNLWLTSDVGVVQSSGTVSQWNDQSGNSNNFSQATPGKQPTYSTTGPNSHQGLTFSAASSQVLNNSSSLGISSKIAYTVICIGKFTSVASNTFFINIGNSAGIAVVASGAKYDFVSLGVADQTVSGADTNFHAFIGTIDAGPLWTLRINGSNQTLSANNATPNNFSANTFIGAGSAGTTAFGNIIVSEIIIYNRVLSAAEIIRIETYIRAKTAIW